MTKTEAAKILVTFVNVRARHYGVVKITKDFIQEMQTEALTWGAEGCLIRQAGKAAPHWKTIQAAGRRLNA